jgi:uncharacterized protein (DUF2141 family)
MLAISRNLLWVCGLMFPLGGAVAAQGAPAAQNVIHVDVTGLRNDKGEVYCALYNSAADFPTDAEKAVSRAKSTIANGKAACEFAGLAPGTYAVATYHDENSNGRLDTNSMGVPEEGVGASNDAKGSFGPPKFDDAAFQFRGGRLDVRINMEYFQ